MNSGNSILLQAEEDFRFLTVEAGCKLTGLEPTTIVKQLATLTALGHLRKFPYLHPRCYWAKRPLGAQGLIYSASLAFRCILAEERSWRPIGCDGAATIIESGEEREALFIDYGASPRYLARKVGDWESPCLVVPTEAKARAVARYAPSVRFTIFPDLWRLQCGKALP